MKRWQKRKKADRECKFGASQLTLTDSCSATRYLDWWWKASDFSLQARHLAHMYMLFPTNSATGDLNLLLSGDGHPRPSAIVVGVGAITLLGCERSVSAKFLVDFGSRSSRKPARF